MSSLAFDSNIVIDALAGFAPAQDIIRDAVARADAWISRMVWIEVMSKGEERALRDAETLLTSFDIDELDSDIARRAATLRRTRPRLKSPDAIILASAQHHGRILVTRNTKDFPADMPGVRIPYTV
jgi:predicted nucleic acid-binding protein